MKKNILIKVLSNDEIAPRIHKIELEWDKELNPILPGQFLHINCGQVAGVFLRRPISICEVDNDKISLVIRDAGNGTHALCQSNIGTVWDVLGPLGNGFSINYNYKNIMIVGGGIGIAPLLELVKQYKGRCVTFLGFKNSPYLLEDFAKYSDVKVATENGNLGYKGYVNDIVKAHMIERRPDKVYACGPKEMLKGIQDLCKEYNIHSEISVEERMACGVGACLVCACKIKNETSGYKHGRVCKDGPVFSGDEVIL